MKFVFAIWNLFVYLRTLGGLLIVLILVQLPTSFIILFKVLQDFMLVYFTFEDTQFFHDIGVLFCILKIILEGKTKSLTCRLMISCDSLINLFLVFTFVVHRFYLQVLCAASLVSVYNWNWIPCSNLVKGWNLYLMHFFQLSVRNCFIRGSVVRYVQLPPEGVDVELLHDATRREARGG